MLRLNDHESGFTLIELLVVIVIIAALFALSTINLGVSQNNASLNTTLEQIVANLKSQQSLAMSGQLSPDGTELDHGIYFSSSNYTLFTNTVYSSSDSSNYSVSTDPVTVSTSFPGDQVVFNTGDGNILSYNSNTAVITLSLNGTTDTINLDRFGAITIN